MAVVNVTPDSFSDGQSRLDPTVAIAHALRLVDAGASLVDIGGESTRPGAEPVGREEELRRVMPVVEHLGGLGVHLSIDTSKLAVAQAALDAGAAWINDVTAFRAEPDIAGLVANRGAMCCLMHMRGDPRTMQRDPRYVDVVSTVKAFLEERLSFAVSQGVSEDRVVLDPGIGFGKTVKQNLEILQRLGELLDLGRPLLIGASRKSFLGAITGRDVHERETATAAANVLAFQRGASFFRVHEVEPTRDALMVALALRMQIEHAAASADGGSLHTFAVAHPGPLTA